MERTKPRQNRRSRLDLLLVDRGLIHSRQIAQTAIMDGCVLVEGEKETKPGKAVRVDSRIVLISRLECEKYVSRGGVKLEQALQKFGISPENRICIDIGASTGGFTDCLLQHGAKKVYAVDVGYGQLAWSLRQDSRVVVRERQNVRYLEPDVLYGEDAQKADLATVDVSFISLKLVLPALLKLLVRKRADIICLIKPQFEVGRKSVGKGGVVRSKEMHHSVLLELLEEFQNLSLVAGGLTYSPIKGPAGNVEFLVYLRGTGHKEKIDVLSVVNEAHAALLRNKTG